MDQGQEACAAPQRRPELISDQLSECEIAVGSPCFYTYCCDSCSSGSSAEVADATAKKKQYLVPRKDRIDILCLPSAAWMTPRTLLSTPSQAHTEFRHEYCTDIDTTQLSVLHVCATYRRDSVLS